MSVFRCLKQVSDACLENPTCFVRQSVRHFSDTCRFNTMNTVTYGCLTGCLTVSDRYSNVTVCLRGVFLEPPRPDTQTASSIFGGKNYGT